MTEHKILYRGFRSDKNGETTITLNDEKIQGEWVYWDVYGRIVGRNNWYGPPDGLISQTEVIPETVEQWAKTDKNGKDVFEDDRVVCSWDNDIGIVKFDEHDLRYVVVTKKGIFSLAIGDWSLIGNKWETK